MSTTGNPRLPPAQKQALQVLTKRPQSMAEEVLVDHGVKICRTIGSPAFPQEEERLRANVTRDVRRSLYPAGLPRQLAAIIADGDRRARLAGVKAPTLVIHGDADPLVPVEGGKDTAAHIPRARLKIIPGMGHDIPLELVDEIADAIAEHAQAATQAEPRRKSA